MDVFALNCVVDENEMRWILDDGIFICPKKAQDSDEAGDGRNIWDEKNRENKNEESSFAEHGANFLEMCRLIMNL